LTLFAVILALAFAFSFVLLGITSVGYFGPSIGDVMAFFAKSVIVIATAATPAIAFLGLLSQRSRLKKYLTRLFSHHS
jgi:hypothetical protein